MLVSSLSRKLQTAVFYYSCNSVLHFAVFANVKMYVALWSLSGRAPLVYQPVWFRLEDDPQTGGKVHVYNGRYWDCKARGDWSDCCNIFGNSDSQRQAKSLTQSVAAATNEGGGQFVPDS